MSVDRDIKEGLVMLDQRLPTPDTYTAYEVLVREARTRTRRTRLLQAGLVAAAAVAVVATDDEIATLLPLLVGNARANRVGRSAHQHDYHREDTRNRLIRLAGRGRLTVTTRALNEAGRRIGDGYRGHSGAAGHRAAGHAGARGRQLRVR